ncbi:MAG: hypothetical protein WKF82_04795 [Nocardioidaceae bacterium]
MGTTCLALRLNASGVWAAAAGVAVATSGYVFYWLMPNWIPGLISIAWLPWLWWAWAGKLSGWRCLGIGLFSYLVIAGGWPATWLMFGALMVGLLCEALVMRQRSDVRAWLAPLAIRAVSAAGGLIAATVTVLPLLRASDYTTRNDKIENSNFLVGNLADMLAFASPALHGDLRTFGGQPMVMIPIYFVAWFALPVLWMITWRRSFAMQPGIVAGAVGVLRNAGTDPSAQQSRPAARPDPKPRRCAVLLRGHGCGLGLLEFTRREPRTGSRYGSVANCGGMAHLGSRPGSGGRLVCGVGCGGDGGPVRGGGGGQRS